MTMMRRVSPDEIADLAAKLLDEPDLAMCEDADSPFPSLRERVGLLLPEVAADIMKDLPVTATGPWKDFERESMYIDGYGTAILPMPEDFLGPILIRLNEWSVSLTRLTDYQTAEARMQKAGNPLRGNPDRPVGVLIPGCEGIELHLHSCRNPSAFMTVGKYLARPGYDSEGMMSLPENSIPSIVREIVQRILVPNT